MIVLLCLLVIAICYLILYISRVVYKHIRIRNVMQKHFPGPELKFFAGCAKDFLGNRGILEVFKDYQSKYGDMVYIRVGPAIHSLIFCEAELSSMVFQSHFNLTKGHAYEFTRGWLGYGLLTTTEENWRKQKELCSPAFNYHLLKDFVPTFNKHIEILLKRLKQLVPIDSINIHSLLSLCSLDIICETVLGSELKAQENQNTEYVKAVKEMCRIIADRSCSILMAYKLFYIFTQDHKIEQKCVKILHSYTDKIIEDRRKKRLDDDEMNKKQRSSLLDMLLDQSEGSLLTDQQIKDEVHTFMFAGHDTVTAAMSFFLYEIAKHEDVQEQLFQEQQSLCEDDLAGPVLESQVLKMDLLKLAIKECLRLYPPVPVYTRRVTQEFKFCNKTIPVGITLSHFAYGLHRNPKYYDDPDKFILRRFETPPPAGSYLPFSFGPRGCIGMRFALNEMTVILAHLIRNFKFKPAEPEHELDLRAEVVLTSKNGINVKVLER